MKTISAKAAHDHWGDLLSEVYFGKEEIAIERKGRVEGVLIHPETYTKLTGKTIPETAPPSQPPTAVSTG